jgi:hypothetical protein
MNRYQATSPCECQASLTAVLDEGRHVLQGSAARLGAREIAPAHSIGAERESSFDIAWACPFCGRNTLRTFHAGGLRRLASTAPVIVEGSAVAAPASAPKPPVTPETKQA